MKLISMEKEIHKLKAELDAVSLYLSSFCICDFSLTQVIMSFLTPIHEFNFHFVFSF